MPSVSERLVWIDCEMTGRSLQTDALVEVAAVVTDAELTLLGEGVDVVIRPPDAALAQMVALSVGHMNLAVGRMAAFGAMFAGLGYDRLGLPMPVGLLLCLTAGAAIGAVVAIPLPFIGPILGALVGGGIGYVSATRRG